MDIVDRAQDKIEHALNAEGRSREHVALGLLICLGAIAVTSAVAVARPQPVAPGAGPTRQPAMRLIWPAVFSVTTFAAIRVWNAPASPHRTRTLTLWGALQGLNTMWMLWRPRDKATQLVAALSTAALTAAYARSASYVDEKAAALVAPTGFAEIATLLVRRG